MEEIPDSGRNMQGYILTYSRFKKIAFDSSGFSTDGALMSESTVPRCCALMEKRKLATVYPILSATIFHMSRHWQHNFHETCSVAANLQPGKETMSLVQTTSADQMSAVQAAVQFPGERCSCDDISLKLCTKILNNTFS